MGLNVEDRFIHKYIRCSDFKPHGDLFVKDKHCYGGFDVIIVDDLGVDGNKGEFRSGIKDLNGG